jgi:hypothetical protein
MPTAPRAAQRKTSDGSLAVCSSIVRAITPSVCRSASSVVVFGQVAVAVCALIFLLRKSKNFLSTLNAPRQPWT